MILIGIQELKNLLIEGVLQLDLKTLKIKK